MMDERKHLTRIEVDKLLAATKGARNEARDRCLILLMFRHGLRVSEAVGLKLSDVDMEGRSLYVKRLKKGLSTTQPLRSEELRALKAWLTERARMKPPGKALFVSERRQPLSRKTAWVMIRDYGRKAGLEIVAHPRICAMLAGSRLPTKRRRHALFKIISNTGTFSIPNNTPPPIRRGLKGCGGKSTMITLDCKNRDSALASSSAWKC